MLENAGTLVDADEDDTWRKAIADRVLAKDYVALLAEAEYRTPQDLLKQSRQACRRCFRLLHSALFAKFPSYPIVEDQFIKSPTENLAFIVGRGLETTYEELRAWGHGPTAGNWRPFFRIRNFPKARSPRKCARRIVALIHDFFGEDLRLRTRSPARSRTTRWRIGGTPGCTA
ncbi:hypothetical protein DFJ74DRAFT_675044 [Hyaloraphidium curvatum]|nr:hypothetical protein DFJ74DRAFT_675044 [Hyaloraphidium curvatum]